MKSLDVVSLNGGAAAGSVEISDALSMEAPNISAIRALEKAELQHSHTLLNYRGLGRHDVHGSTRKLWRQKGTGRARVGNGRSNVWRSGGVAFGGTVTIRPIKVMKKVRLLAYRSALSLLFKSEGFKVVDASGYGSEKTKDFVKACDGVVTINPKKSTLFVVSDTKEGAAMRKSGGNLRGIRFISAERFALLPLLKADMVVLEKGALLGLNTWLEGKRA